MEDDTCSCPWCAETIKNKAIICRFCNRPVNAEAVAAYQAQHYPSSPVQPAVVSRRPVIALMLLAVILFVSLILNYVHGPSTHILNTIPEPSTPSTPSNANAYTMCQRYIEHARDKVNQAEWPSIDGVQITQSGTTFTVNGYVYVPNFFGQKQRRSYTCVTTLTTIDSSPRWTMDSVQTYKY